VPEPALPPNYLPFAALLRGESGEDLQLDEPLWLTSAPGRLDLLGGPGERSGTASLAMPLARSVYCAIQNRADQEIRIRCLLPAARGGIRTWNGAVSDLYTKKGPPRSLAVLRQFFAETGHEWMMTLVASMLGLRRTRQLNTPKVGFSMVIWSRLPDETGFGERAAFGVSTALAFKASTGLAKKRVDGIQVARAVVHGALEVLDEEIPLSETLCSALGRRNCLLHIEHGIEPSMQWVPLPQQCAVGAVDIGAVPEVAEGELGPEARRKRLELQAEMALAILNNELKKDKKMPFTGWGRVAPKEWDKLKALVPSQIAGAEWLQLFRRSKDQAELANLVDKDSTYRLRSIAEFSVDESERVRRFVSNVGEYARTLREAFMVEAGRNLNRSQKALSERVGLNTDAVEGIMADIKARGRNEGMFGARLADFGRSGVMAVLVHQSSRQKLRDLAETHRIRNAAHVNVVTDTEDGGVLSGWWNGILDPREPDPPAAAEEPAAKADGKAVRAKKG